MFALHVYTRTLGHTTYLLKLIIHVVLLCSGCQKHQIICLYLLLRNVTLKLPNVPQSKHLTASSHGNSSMQYEGPEKDVTQCWVQWCRSLSKSHTRDNLVWLKNWNNTQRCDWHCQNKRINVCMTALPWFHFKGLCFQRAVSVFDLSKACHFNAGDWTLAVYI